MENGPGMWLRVGLGLEHGLRCFVRTWASAGDDMFCQDLD